MEQNSSKKRLWVGLAIFFFLLLAGGIIWYFFGGTKAGDDAQNLFPFGAPSEGGDTRTNADTDRHEIGGEEGGGEGAEAERLFRQLANVPIAGAYALERGGEQYVRYIERETGHAYEVPIESGESRQLTVTTIPRVAIADWADNGNAVVLRYLEEEQYTGREIIKTNLGRLPVDSASVAASAKEASKTRADLSSSSASSSSLENPYAVGVGMGDFAGPLTIEFLPDNIVALSVADDGKDLFYLLKKGGETSGSIVNLSTRVTKEVFRHSFSECTPQLLNDDTIILTTKPSGAVPGFSYLYDPRTKALTRLVREKDGLTTFGNSTGSRLLFGENIAGNTTLNAYNSKGFAGDEGTVFHEQSLPLATLPEKCAWLKDGVRVLCGAFITTPRGIPDLWYQGSFFFDDTFWSVDVDSGEISYLADPKEEVGQAFDIINPMLSKNDAYFIFINKRDSMLWALRILQKTPPTDLSPEELPATN